MFTEGHAGSLYKAQEKKTQKDPSLLNPCPEQWAQGILPLLSLEKQLPE